MHDAVLFDYNGNHCVGRIECVLADNSVASPSLFRTVFDISSRTHYPDEDNEKGCLRKRP